MKKIYYLGYYDTESNRSENRNYVLAATNKMTYICSALNRAGWDVEIVSASGTKNRESYPGKKVPVNEHITLTLFPTAGRGGKIKNVLRRWLLHGQFFFYLLKHIKKEQPVLVYHSLGYLSLIRILKKIKKFRLLLEVEEIYADVIGSKKWRKREMRLFDLADAFVFPTELLEEHINLRKKPSVIIYGTYQMERKRDGSLFYEQEKEGEHKIHLLYAGTFDPRKGGAAAAASAAESLPEQYHVHIIGFGSEKDTGQLLDQIQQINRNSAAKVTYDGLLSGEEYIQFVQSCQVGFSTQQPEGAFNETSFPSKVLSYLANGLRVVSIRIEALERSKISSLLYYYDENTPEAIAEAVQNIDFSEEYDSRAVIQQLDQEFVKKVENILLGI